MNGKGRGEVARDGERTKELEDADMARRVTGYVVQLLNTTGRSEAGNHEVTSGASAFRDADEMVVEKIPLGGRMMRWHSSSARFWTPVLPLDTQSRCQFVHHVNRQVTRIPRIPTPWPWPTLRVQGVEPLVR